jgi:hypothetical protein
MFKLKKILYQKKVMKIFSVKKLKRLTQNTKSNVI